MKKTDFDSGLGIHGKELHLVLWTKYNHNDPLIPSPFIAF